MFSCVQLAAASKFGPGWLPEAGQSRWDTARADCTALHRTARAAAHRRSALTARALYRCTAVHMPCLGWQAVCMGVSSTPRQGAQAEDIPPNDAARVALTALVPGAPPPPPDGAPAAKSPLISNRRRAWCVAQGSAALRYCPAPASNPLQLSRGQSSVGSAYTVTARCSMRSSVSHLRLRSVHRHDANILSGSMQRLLLTCSWTSTTSTRVCLGSVVP